MQQLTSRTKKILSIKVTTDEYVHDDRNILPKLVKYIAKSKKNIAIDKIIADDGTCYSNMLLFLNVLQTIEFYHVKVRENARVKKTNHLQKSFGYISEKGFAKVGGPHCNLWKQVDCC